jgi:OMF family outer membrane factor
MVVVLVLSTGAPSRLLSRADSILPICETRIRFEVEQSFLGLRAAIQSIDTTAIEVLSSKESLRLSQLRVQAGVGVQREVVNNQRDLTQAELKYARAINSYNSNLALLQRRTGLDALIACNAVSLTGTNQNLNKNRFRLNPRR